jgi:hypothetical protein
VAIAEPRNAVREHYAKYFEVDAGLVFPDWKDVCNNEFITFIITFI